MLRIRARRTTVNEMLIGVARLLAGPVPGGLDPGELHQLVDDEQGIQFLGDPGGVLGAQDLLVSAQVGLQVRVSGF